MYAATHAFLPERNGIRPNTLHVFFDIVTLAILIDLAVPDGIARQAGGPSDRFKYRQAASIPQNV
jgi:hypothetical protein